jgi:hypothetical protein
MNSGYSKSSIDNIYIYCLIVLIMQKKEDKIGNLSSFLRKLLLKIPELKRSQITIFIIFAILLVVLIILLFYSMRTPIIPGSDERNPQAVIEACTRESAEDAIEILSAQGGDIVPNGSVKYLGEDITYLCYNANYYESCINQRPLLIEHIENEITNYIKPIVEECFIRLEMDFKSRYDNLELSPDMKITTRLFPEQVIVEIYRDLKMSRGKDTREFHKFKMNMAHPIYNLAEIAMEIANQEAQYCNFDDLGFMIIYPRWNIESTITGESDSIYFIKERSTNQKFNFAIKSCMMPPGF